MPKQPMKKPMAKKTGVKSNPSKDYMKPVGGTKQEGYKAPGSVLKGRKRSGPGYSVGSSAQSSGTKTVMQKIKAYAPVAKAPDQKYLKTGINPTAMKATAGNPKPTASQMATAKKKAASKAKSKLMETQAQKKKNTKPARGSTKGSTIGSKPLPKPTTGVYKRGNP
jgi:hypothetical protein